MARQDPLIASFNGGEWSPLLHGRADLAKYRNAQRQIINMLGAEEGPATRRPGTHYVANTKSQTVAGRVLGFEFGVTQAYIIEASASAFRYYMNRGRIETSPGVPYELANPYTDPGQIKFAQSADTMYICYPGLQPRKLTRSGHTNWSLSLVNFRDGPWLAENISSTTMTPSGNNAGSSITVTASAATFAASDVGRQIRLFSDSGSPALAGWGWGIITAFTSSTVVTATLQTDLVAAESTKRWRLGAWWGTTWPTCCAFFEERLWFANSPLQPQTLWGSVAGDYEGFGATTGFADTRNNTTDTAVSDIVTDDAAITRTISDNQVNPILWMSAGDYLFLGTPHGEKVVKASTLNQALTPSNVTVRGQSRRGSADPYPPVLVDQNTIFIQRARRKLFELSYDFQKDGYSAPELSLTARHLTRGQLAEMAYQAEPWSIIWTEEDASGKLLGLTYLPAEDIRAWHQHQLGGRRGNYSYGAVQSVASIPGTTQDELWMIVERTVQGAPRFTVEYLGYEYWPDGTSAEAKEAAYFVDSGLQYDGWNLTTSQTLALSGFVTWTDGETGGTMTAAGFSPFSGASVGRIYGFRQAGVEGEPIGKVQVTGFTNSTHVTVKLLTPIIAKYRSVATSSWGLAATTVTGLAHIIGETAQILGDGAVQPDQVIAAGGTLTLTVPAFRVSAGLGYESRIDSLDLEGGSLIGSARGKPRRIPSVNVSLFATLGCLLGPDEDHLEELQFRATGMVMDSSPPLFTGERKVDMPGGWDRQARITVIQRQPLPLTVVALRPALTTEDG